MKLFAVFLTIFASLAFTEALIRWRPIPGACVDCYGRFRGEGERYFDGCNWCTCSWNGGPACTYMDCYYNRCFKN
ncbi:serine protease inhibitor 3-like [Ruditapes philippinarum]|uniref:serine protease inhibitor 3-like n=1 Tax=Ruditapes philippinarum TaxID=129788 RepID=UPI00295B6114|nr:serine protease inhibitor 3-like [Ruditapes philippinarum]